MGNGYFIAATGDQRFRNIILFLLVSGSNFTPHGPRVIGSSKIPPTVSQNERLRYRIVCEKMLHESS